MPVSVAKTSSEIPPELADHPRYRVEGQLGVGGMGVVYKAEHVLMGRTVAVKVMAQRFTANAVAVERFRREVRAAAKLAHPNIVTAYDADEAGGRHFLVMEYVEGVSLDRVVNRRGPLPVATACHVARQVALGLQHAHAKGMIHRDVKPQNVMVNRKVQVKVLDFGLARLSTEADLPTSGASGPQPVAVTGTNLVVGTPDYLSPEQAMAARDIDHRSDVYSLGCLLHFTLTGRPPFAAAKTVFDKVLAHANEDPPPLNRDDVPPELLALLAKLMAKAPADRFASAADAAAALLPFTKAGTATAVVPAATVDFEFGDGSAETDTLITPPPAAWALPKPRRAWAFYATLAAVGLGLFLLLAALTPPAGEKSPPQPAAATKPAKVVPPPVAPAGRVLFVLPKKGLAPDDYELVRARLVELGAKVTTAARQRGPCALAGGSLGPAVPAELALADVKPDEYDAILFPGYDVSEFLTGEGHRQLEPVVRAMNDARKVVGGIGRGVRVLVPFRVLLNRQAAVPEGEANRPRDKAAGVTWEPWKRVVTDGHVVTAGGSKDAREFADAVHAAMTREGK